MPAKFLEDIQKSGVLGSKAWLFYVSGSAMYLATLAFYVLLANHMDSHDWPDGFRDDMASSLLAVLWVTVGLHVLVGVLVGLDTWQFSGSNVFLQTIIIGAGSFNTIFYGGYFATTLVVMLSDFQRDNDSPIQETEHLIYAAGSFSSACLANAMMLALLFAMFHSKQSTGLAALNKIVNAKNGQLVF